MIIILGNKVDLDYEDVFD